MLVILRGTRAKLRQMDSGLDSAPMCSHTWIQYGAGKSGIKCQNAELKHTGEVQIQSEQQSQSSPLGVLGLAATLGKCFGSHNKDRKDKYNDKYMEKTNTKTNKDRPRQE